MSDTKYITLDNLATFKTNYDSIVNNIREVAEGKTATYVIDAKSDITGTEDANGQFTNVSAITGLTIADLKLGDVILIKALDVSDYWVSQLNKTGDVVTSVSLNKMETTKVDLTQFYTKTQIDDTFKYDLPLLDLLPNNTKLINNYSMAEITQAVWGTTTFSNIGSKAVIRRIKCYYEVDENTVSTDNGIAIITFKNIFSSYYILNLELINSLIDYHFTWTNYNDTAETAITVSNNKVEANATVPSGTSLNALNNLRVGNNYYEVPDPSNVVHLVYNQAVSVDDFNKILNGQVTMVEYDNNYYALSGISSGSPMFDLTLIPAGANYITNTHIAINSSDRAWDYINTSVNGASANVTIPSGTTATDLSNLKIGSSYYKIPTTSINNHTGRFNLWGALVQDYTGENPLIAICPALRLRLYNQNGQWELQYLEYDSSYNLDYSKLMTFIGWLEQKYCEYPEITINDYVNNVNYSGKTLVLTTETQNNVPHLVLRGIIQKEDGTPCNLSVAVPVETDPQTQDPVIGTPLVSIDEFSGGSGGSKLYEISMDLQRYDNQDNLVSFYFDDGGPNFGTTLPLKIYLSDTNFENLKVIFNPVLSSVGMTTLTDIQSLLTLLNTLIHEHTAGQINDYAYFILSWLINLSDRAYMWFVSNNLPVPYQIWALGEGLALGSFTIGYMSLTGSIKECIITDHDTADPYMLELSGNATVATYESGGGSGGSSSSEYNKMQRYAIDFNDTRGLIIITKLTQAELADDIAYTNSQLDVINTAMGTSFTHITTISDLSTTISQANTFDNTGGLASMLVGMFIVGEVRHDRLVSVNGATAGGSTFPILKYTPINQNDNIVNYSFTYLDDNNQFQTVTIDGLNAAFSYEEF